VALQKRGLRLQYIYDIGANHGQWTKRIEKVLSQDSCFFLFEGSDRHATKLAQQKWPWFSVVLGSEDTEATWWGSGGLGDSLYPEVGIDPRTAPRHSVHVRRLDEFVVENKIPLPDFLKIDTQGSELAILKGGSNCLSCAALVVLEVPVIPYNQGTPLLHEYISFMMEKSFVPVAVTEIHLMHGVLVQLDIAFLRQDVYTTVWGINKTPFLPFVN